MTIVVFRIHIAIPSNAPRVVEITELLPRRPSAAAIKENLEREPDVLAIDDEEADDVFRTLSSATARAMLAALYERPRTTSELADEVDTSLQNTTYHVNKLRECDLIEVVETWYSDQGKEMKVYAPTNKALVLFAGDDIHRSSLFDVIKRLVGVAAIFAVLGLLIERLTRPGETGPEPVTPGAGGPTTDPWLIPLSPGAMFFLGSLLALLLVTAWWYYRYA